MTEQIQRAYDQVPYRSVAFSQTHPGALAAIARLFGVHTGDVCRCRVLEIGCAEGGNLIPMAAQLPDCQFLGVDLSARQIAAGRQLIQHAGLTNIRLEQCHLADLAAASGGHQEQFDYIIAHGVLSWVPHDVQQRLLEVMARRLAPSGVAYLSYNTLPGCLVSSAFRSILHDPARPDAGSSSWLTDVRSRVELLRDFPWPEQSLLAGTARNEAEQMLARPLKYFRHDLLAEENHAFYFSDIVSRASAAGLEYLADAEVPTMIPELIGPEVARDIRQISRNLIETEQLLDLYRNRPFRCSLLVRSGVQIRRELSPASLAGLYLSGNLTPAAGSPDLTEPGRVCFETPGGATATVTQPVTKHALAILGEIWPGNITFEDLTQQARQRLRAAQTRNIELTPQAQPRFEADAHAVGQALWQCFLQRIVALRADPYTCVTTLPEYPLVSRLTRTAAAQSMPITSQRHETVNTDPPAQLVLTMMDGTLSRDDILNRLVDHAIEGTLNLAIVGDRLDDPDRIRTVLTEHLEGWFRTITEAALLVPSDPLPASPDLPAT